METDVFFVDTNVWITLAYPKSLTRQFGPHATGPVYTAFLSACAAARSSLLWSALSFSELAHTIEKIEFAAYNASVPEAKRCTSVKEFRLGTVERQTVVTEVEMAWGQIESLGTALPTPTDQKAFAASKALFSAHTLDGYDIFFVNAMHEARMTAVLTDDIDYLSVPGLRVFTANATAIARARLFRKLQ